MPKSVPGLHDTNLLLETSQSLLEIAQVARSNETEGEDRIFYSHLQFHCLRFIDQINYSIQTRLPLQEQHTATILSLFGALVPETSVQEPPPYPVSSNFRLQRPLILHPATSYPAQLSTYSRVLMPQSHVRTCLVLITRVDRNR